jgi:glucan 1,3-beta-glucosidase
MNGVNLGGWLVLEKWLTPSLFKGIEADDEYHFMETKMGQERIALHRDTFITEADWQWLAHHSISFVRLPIGYWALRDDGPFKNTAAHLDWAFTMAEKYDIKVLLDLHALKGSQNGEAHSGLKGKVGWWPYRYEMLDVVKDLAQRYKASPALRGVQIINEPKVVGHYFHLLWYYRKAYKVLRSVLHPGTFTVFHDGFIAPLFNGALWRRKGFPVIMDSHYYLLPANLFSGMTPLRYDAIRGSIYKLLITTSSWFQPVIVGEWGSVLPQPMFNREKQQRHLEMLGDTIKRQQKIYNKAIATAFWSYKAEGRGMYHFRSLVEDGIIQQIDP